MNNPIIFSKEWFADHQKGLLRLANTRIGRRLLYINGDKSAVGNNKITQIAPNFIQWIDDGKTVHEFRSHDKFSKRLYHSFKPLWHLLHAWDMRVANKLTPKLNAGFDTLTAYPQPTITVDGYVGATGYDKTHANLRAATGNLNSDGDTVAGVLLQSNATTNHYVSLYRMIMLFDTSSVNDGHTITDATLSLRLADDDPLDSVAAGLGSTSIRICSSSPASNTALQDSDYGQLGSVQFSSVSMANLGAGYNDFPLDANGIANVSLTGISKFGARLGWDLANNFTGTWSSNSLTYVLFQASEYSGTSNDPKLVITSVAAVPTVTTQAVTNVSSVTATGNGTVVSDGGGTITERGVCWNTTGTPTTADPKATSAGTTGAYSVSITGISSATTYYARAYAINSSGTSYGSDTSFTTVGFTNPANAYASDNTYTTIASASGDIGIQLSGDAGATYSTALTKTYTSSEASQTYGNGSTELWGLSWLGSNVSNTNFRLKVGAGGVYQVYKTFGFAPGGSVELTGIEVSVEAKWDGTTTSIDHIKVKIYYGTSTTPVQAGSMAYATDGATTGALEAYNGSAWKELVDTNSSQTLTNKSISASQLNSGTIAASQMPALTGGVTSSAGSVATTVASISKNNLTTDSNPYKFSVTNSGGKTVTTGADRQLTFDTETYDTNGNFASDLYTAPVAGFYSITGFVSWPATGSMTRMIMRLYKNGSSIHRLADVQTNAAASGCGGTILVQLAANDTLGLYVQPIGAGTTTNSGVAEYYFMGHLVSRT